MFLFTSSSDNEYRAAINCNIKFFGNTNVNGKRVMINGNYNGTRWIASNPDSKLVFPNIPYSNAYNCLEIKGNSSSSTLYHIGSYYCTDGIYIFFEYIANSLTNTSIPTPATPVV